ncbi:PAS domain-containing protein [Ectothiorhodospiraceae bacterium 2226]|nr:PAS domain-containing protein [Ectothiorhodospiraceae bacterium 2226]
MTLARDDGFMLAGDWLPEPVLLIDGQGILIDANGAARAYFGEARLRSGGRLHALLADAERLEPQLERWRRTRTPMPVTLPWLSAERQVWAWQARLVQAGGESRDVRILLRASPASAPSRFFALNRELNVERRARRELQVRRAELAEREARVRATLGAAGVGTWEWDIDAGRVTWSPELEEAHGLAPGSFGGTVSDALADIHPEDAPRVTAAIERARRGLSDYEVEYRIVRPDGQVRWVEAKAHVTRDPEGNALRLSGVCMDVTARKEADLARRESERRFRVMADAAPVMIWLAGTDRLRSYFNRGWLEFTGRPPISEAQGGWTQGVHPEDRARCDAEYRRAFEARTPFKVEYRLCRHDGVYRWVLDHGIPRFDTNGSFAGYIGSAIDITPRREMEHALREQADRLAELDRRKDEFLAMLAHELRNPLAPIAAAAQLLSAKARDSASVEWAAQMITRQTAHLAHLVDDLLDVARITRGRVTLQRQVVALGEVVERALETARPLIEGNAHRVHLTLPDEPLYADADPVRLVQVVGNLLNNAAKYSEPERRIWVTLAREEGAAVLRVRDEGSGIEPDMLPRVFDLFAQAQDTLARSRGGMGLGLTLARRLVELHGGSMDAHSEGAGKGAEFVVRLPVLVDTGAAAAREAAGEDRNAVQVPRRVLVVDDNDDIREALAALLREAGHTVDAVDGGPAALEAVRRRMPDIVFLDIGLPEMDGYEVAARLRAEHGARPYLVAFSGYGQAQDIARAKAAGFDHHLLKPGTFERVEALIAQCPVAPVTSTSET